MTRAKILEAAAEIFSEKGFHATSMQDIACAVNLQKASLYHHISGKQEILLALLDQALDILIEEVGTAISLPLTTDEKLRRAILAYLQILTNQRGLAAVLLFEHRSLDAELRFRHLPRRDRFEGLWRGVIQEGVESGVFDSSDPSQAARALLGVMNWTITWYRDDGLLTVQEISEQYADMFLKGLLVRQ